MKKFALTWNNSLLSYGSQHSFFFRRLCLTIAHSNKSQDNTLKHNVSAEQLNIPFSETVLWVVFIDHWSTKRRSRRLLCKTDTRKSAIWSGLMLPVPHYMQYSVLLIVCSSIFIIIFKMSSSLYNAFWRSKLHNYSVGGKNTQSPLFFQREC